MLIRLVSDIEKNLASISPTVKKGKKLLIVK